MLFLSSSSISFLSFSSFSHNVMPLSGCLALYWSDTNWVKIVKTNWGCSSVCHPEICQAGVRIFNTFKVAQVSTWPNDKYLCCEFLLFSNPTVWLKYFVKNTKRKLRKIEKNRDVVVKITKIWSVVLQISPPYFLLVNFVFVTNLYCCLQKAMSSDKIEFDSDLYVSML